jgi:hypothetical protein
MQGMVISPYALYQPANRRALVLRTSNLPQGYRQVLGANLNCSE